MDGLERVFQQFDVIRSHAPEHGPPMAEHDAPPWQAEGKANSQHPVQAEGVINSEHPQEAARPAPQVDEPQKPVPSDRSQLDALGYRNFRSWGDVRAAKEEKAQQRIEERLRNPNGASFEQDEEGLAKAYNDTTGPGTYYDPATKSLYVKGTTTKRDIWDDFTKVPFWGDLRDSQRFQQADKAYEDLLAQGKPTDRIVGHSLGGSVALELQKEKGIELSRTFGAPVLDLNFTKSSERYRHILDPISVLDRSAKLGSLAAYPHSYTGYGFL